MICRSRRSTAGGARTRAITRVSTRVSIALISLAVFGACSQLVFLKPPSVPRKKGSSATMRGPAFARDSAQRTAPSAIADWPMYNRSYDGTRFSPLSQITAGNVSSLVPACTYPLGVTANMQSGLIAVGGTLYFTTATDTYAMDAATCALRWQHHYDYNPKPPFDPNKVNRGVDVSRGTRSRAALSRSEQWARDGARSGNGRGAVVRGGRRPLEGRDVSSGADRLEWQGVHGQRGR